MQLALLVFCMLQMAIQIDSETNQQSPIEVVNERNRALNAHELDAFLDTYADDVAIYVFPDKQIGSGKQHVRKIFSMFIENKAVKTKVTNTMAADGFVVVESVTTFGKKSEEGVAIYEIRKGKIKTVRFLRDTLRAKQKTVSAGS